MDLIEYKKQFCPKCKADVASHFKFCPKCGRRIGFGVRSEGEVRAAIHNLKNCTFTLTDITLRPFILSDISLMTSILEWCVGQHDIAPLDMLVEGLKASARIRRSNE